MALDYANEQQIFGNVYYLKITDEMRKRRVFCFCVVDVVIIILVCWFGFRRQGSQYVALAA